MALRRSALVVQVEWVVAAEKAARAALPVMAVWAVLVKAVPRALAALVALVALVARAARAACRRNRDTCWNASRTIVVHAYSKMMLS